MKCIWSIASAPGWSGYTGEAVFNCSSSPAGFEVAWCPAGTAARLAGGAGCTAAAGMPPEGWLAHLVAEQEGSVESKFITNATSSKNVFAEMIVFAADSPR